MMQKITLMFTAVLLILGLSGFDDAKFQTNHYTKSQIESFIREVFADQADTLVLNSDTSRLEVIEDFLARVEILNKPEYAGKKFKLLSAIALQDKYNPKLSRDQVYNPATFNPLKYKFPMISTNKEIFRFDNTDYVIIIQPIK